MEDSRKHPGSTCCDLGGVPTPCEYKVTSCLQSASVMVSLIYSTVTFIGGRL